MSGRLEGKVAVITGGTKGIGESMTRLFAREGAVVNFVGRSPETGEALEHALRGEGLDARFISADVGDEAGAAEVAAIVGSEHGRMDSLVLNAGIVYPGHGRFWEVDPADFDEVFRVNVRGVYLMARAAEPVLRPGSSIVVVASMASYVVLPHEMVYSASKGAVLQLARGMAVDLADRNVRVNILCPGYTDAGQTHAVLDEADDPDALRERFESAPLGRMGTAEEMARAAMFLASDDSTYCTGASLVVDGGFTLL